MNGSVWRLYDTRVRLQVARQKGVVQDRQKRHASAHCYRVKYAPNMLPKLCIGYAWCQDGERSNDIKAKTVSIHTLPNSKQPAAFSNLTLLV